MVFQLPVKILHAHGLKFGNKVRVTLDRTTGQRHPFLFADLARDEDKAREIGLRLEGTTEVDVSPRRAWLTHQNGEQRKKLIKDFDWKTLEKAHNRRKLRDDLQAEHNVERG